MVGLKAALAMAYQHTEGRQEGREGERVADNTDQAHTEDINNSDMFESAF